jgi:hypothetical protein
LGLASILAWSARRPSTRTWAADGVAMALGLTATILGLGGIILVDSGIGLEIWEAGLSRLGLIHLMTHPRILAGLSSYDLLPGWPGSSDYIKDEFGLDRLVALLG